MERFGITDSKIMEAIIDEGKKTYEGTEKKHRMVLKRMVFFSACDIIAGSFHGLYVYKAK